jgi:hypothetical protein
MREDDDDEDICNNNGRICCSPFARLDLAGMRLREFFAPKLEVAGGG